MFAHFSFYWLSQKIRTEFQDRNIESNSKPAKIRPGYRKADKDEKY